MAHEENGSPSSLDLGSSPIVSISARSSVVRKRLTEIALYDIKNNIEADSQRISTKKDRAILPVATSLDLPREKPVY
jgi:hypothetical protein